MISTGMTISTRLMASGLPDWQGSVSRMFSTWVCLDLMCSGILMTSKLVVLDDSESWAVDVF